MDSSRHAGLAPVAGMVKVLLITHRYLLDAERTELLA